MDDQNACTKKVIDKTCHIHYKIVRGILQNVIGHDQMIAPITLRGMSCNYPWFQNPILFQS